MSWVNGYNNIYTFQDTNIEIEYSINNLALEGTTTKNNNFKVLEDGSIEAHNGYFSGTIEVTGGSISDTTIDGYASDESLDEVNKDLTNTKNGFKTGTTKIVGGCIETGNIKSGNYVANKSGTLINLDNGVIDSKNFKVSSSGDVAVTGTITSSNANITGGAVNILGTGTGNVTLKTHYGNHNTYMSPSNMYQSNGSQHTKIGLTAVSGQSESYGMEIVKGTNQKTYINADLRPWVDNPIIRVVGNGSGFGIDATNGVVGVSDRRKKEEIVYIDDEISKNIIKNLQPCTYKFKNKERYHRGFIAQDVEQALNLNNIKDQLYLIDEKGEYSLVYDEFLADLVGCCKYLIKRVEELENVIKENN